MAANWTATLARRRGGRARNWTAALERRRGATPSAVELDWRAIAEASGLTKRDLNRWAQALAGELGQPRPLKIEDASAEVRTAALAHFGGGA